MATDPAANLHHPCYGRAFCPQGDLHPMATRRTFGSSAPVRVKLYRDHASWCARRCVCVWGGGGAGAAGRGRGSMSVLVLVLVRTGAYTKRS